MCLYFAFSKVNCRGEHGTTFELQGVVWKVQVQRRWVLKRPSPWGPALLLAPRPGLGAMPPRGGRPLTSRSLIMPAPTILRGPPRPRSLHRRSLRSSTPQTPPPRISRSRTALVFFSSTFRRTSPRKIMGLAAGFSGQDQSHQRQQNRSLATFHQQPWY